MLRFDDVLNDQRKIVFDQRLALMEDDRISDVVADMRHGFVDDLVRQHLSAGGRPPSWDWEILDLEVRSVLTLDVPVSSWKQESDIQAACVRDYIADVADSWMAGKVDRWGDSRMRVALRRVVIALLDDLWLRHVSDLEMLRRAAPLRAHGRRDPLVEFKIEAFELFEQMLCRLRRNVTAATMRVGFEDDVPTQPIETEEEHDVFVPDHLVNALH
jgi:preprotein translocase subunit SecA